jgi:protein phosphatase 1 regulatory subunit 37
MLSTALKQLFFASIGLTSAGAIMLAEFLPKRSALLALGLAENNIDIAGVFALNGGLEGTM